MKLSAFVLLGAFLGADAAFYERFEDVPIKKWDFIVVGGGVGGNVIANRLSEDPKVNVIVLEAGRSNKDALEVEVPFYYPRLQGSQYDWNFTTTPQAALNNRTIPFPRGFVIGGSSSINAMIYTRGPSDDFNRFANVTGDDGWSWNSVQSYIRKNEKFVPPADHHNITGEFIPSVHSFNGINSVSLSGWGYSSDAAMVKATKELPEFPFNEDMNSGYHLGYGWTQWTIGNGARSSSAISYLGPGYIKRPNLAVLLHARVLRLGQTTNSSSNIAFREVQFTQDAGAVIHNLTASKEIILSAGSIMTPTILLHSGIGNSTELRAVGITSLHELPSVGKNLTDHPLLVSLWNVNSTDTPDTFLNNATLAAEVERRWNETHTGPLVAPQGRWVGWFRHNLSLPIWKGIEDPSSGPNSAHYEMITGNGVRGTGIPAGHYLSFTIAVVSPTSTGTVTINSTNPLDPPLINPNYLQSNFDFLAMREAFLATRRFASAPAWKGYLLSEVVNITNDDDLDEFIRNSTTTIFHPVSTARMSRKGEEWGVVDPDLRVKGVEGLRIVDASVLPYIPTAHTQVPTYVFAERAADLIKTTYGLA